MNILLRRHQRLERSSNPINPKDAVYEGSSLGFETRTINGPFLGGCQPVDKRFNHV